MSERDDRLLQEQMQKFAAANDEVDGDDDEEEDVGMGEVDIEGNVGLVE